MSKELPFFKFDPTEWLIGRISFQPIDVQGAFTQACCMYWKLGGKMKDSDIDYRIGKEYLQKLKDLNFIKQEGDFLRIVFLDNQISECHEVREKMKLLGALGGSKKSILAHAKRTLSEGLPDAKRRVSGGVLSKSKSKNKEREEKKKFIPPSLEEVRDYFVTHGFKTSVADQAYRGYHENNWHDSKNNPVTNWKSKMNNVWFKEENLDHKLLPLQKKEQKKHTTREEVDSLFGEK